MTREPELAALVLRAIVPMLAWLGIAVAVLVGLALARRAGQTSVHRHRRAIAARYRPLVDGLLQPSTASVALAELLPAPPRHRKIVGQLLLATLRVAGGEAGDYVRAATASLGLRDAWRRSLRNGRWRARADAARALGLVRDGPSVDSLVAALNDSHDAVRAAAVEALGAMGSPAALPALLVALAEPARHQRMPILEALRRVGPAAVPALVGHARRRPEDATALIEIVGLVGGPDAAEPLLGWTDDARLDVRVAAIAALGSVGLDDRSFYYALRALGDDSAGVRSAAARALGHARRPAAARYLAAHMDDTWDVAAAGAWALRQLGPPGLDALVARVGDAGQAGDLARQVLRGRTAEASAS